jgi:acetyl esterase
MALDDATAAYLDRLAAAGAKPVQESTPQEARLQYAARRNLIGPGPELASVREEVLTSADGAQFRVRVLVPDGGVRALIVYYHGGGWVLGSVDDFDALGRTLATRLAATVVLVDYRLAPEHRYPAAADDAWAALNWASEHATEIAGGPVPLIVMGDSAGGNLAAVVAQRGRAAGAPQIDYQVLVYPVTDADLDNATYRAAENQLATFSRDSMSWFWDQYVPEPGRRRDPDVSPLRAASVAGLPPAIVLTAEHDVLRQEGEAYADRLREAGVPVTLRRFPGQMHGFFALMNILPGHSAAMTYLADELGPKLAAPD